MRTLPQATRKDIRDAGFPLVFARDVQAAREPALFTAVQAMIAAIHLDPVVPSIRHSDAPLRPVFPAGLSVRVDFRVSPVAYRRYRNRRTGRAAVGIGYRTVPAPEAGRPGPSLPAAGTPWRG